MHLILIRSQHRDTQASVAQSAARQSHNLKAVSSSLTRGKNFLLFLKIFKVVLLSRLFLNKSYWLLVSGTIILFVISIYLSH